MKNSETEQKIKSAASIVFKQKGFKEARTRDIAEQAGVNLALINYYYKSKEALFNEIMTESIIAFKQNLCEYINDETTSAHEKISIVVNNYLSLLQQEPNLPIFLIKELSGSTEILKKIKPEEVLKNSFLQKQLHDMGKTDEEIENLVINTMSLVVLPIIGKPIIQAFCSKNEQEYYRFLEQRKANIPIWINNMFCL
ncbi:MAG: TetR/AcrR family transcriptional regulator [Bacteroidales bacterium]|nr:TetR/AcrR family transcriptional regulator [Bacteroidales bacterium]